jgi:hypothetical protein
MLREGQGQVFDNELLTRKITFGHGIVPAFEHHLVGFGKILPQQGPGFQGGLPGSLLNVLEQR